MNKTRKQSKQDQHEDIDKNVIRALRNIYMSYNPDYLNYINDKLKDVMLEDT